MSLDDFKSPLPARKASFETNPEPVEESKDTTRTELPPIEEDKPLTSQPAASQPKKINKNLLIYGGIGASVLLIIALVFGVIIPKLGGGTEKVTTITYWGLWENNSIIEGVIADFEAKNPGIKVVYKMNNKQDYRTRLQGRLAKDPKEVEDVPDLFRIHASWIPMFRDDLANVPSSVVSNIQLETDYYNVYKTDLKDGGVYKAIPLMYDGLSLFYNKELINSAQVSLPKSWWDLQAAAQKLTVRDPQTQMITVAGAALGTTDNVDHWSDIVGLMMKQNGVSALKTDAETKDKIKDVLTFYTNFKTNYKVWDETLPSSTQFFAQGNLGFYFAPSWRVFNIEETKAPNLKYEIMKVPQLPTLENVSPETPLTEGDLTDIHWSTYWVEGVNKRSSKQKEAWKLLEYLSSKEALEKMYTAASGIREFGEIYPRISMKDKAMSNPKTKPFVEAADKASTWYLSSRTFDVNGLNDGMMKYFGDAINKVAINGIEPGNAVGDLSNGINQLTIKYQLER